MLLLGATLAILCASAHASPLLKKDTENVMVRRLSTHYDRLRRSAGCEFPPFLQFEFDVYDVIILLNLERNTHIHSNVPIYVPGDNGQAVREEMNDAENFALYQDMNQGSAMLVSCEEDTTYRLQGSFRYDGVLYHMSPSNEPVASTDHTIRQNHHDKIAYGLDALQPPKSDKAEYDRPVNSTNRQKRAVPTGNIVEMVFAVDNSIYQYFLSEQGTKTAAEEAIRREVTMLANEVDVYFAGIPSVDATVDIRIFVSGVFIDDDSGLSDWSANSLVTIGGKDYLSYNQLIDEVRIWRQGQTQLPEHDHLMALSLIEFAVIQSGAVTSDSITGVAYVGTVCSNPSSSVSFTQMEFSGRTAQTVAHELGHALSAEHDGTGNTCSTGDNNVMTPIFSLTTSSTYAAAQWTFSSCSVNYFKNHLNSLTSGSHCMLQHSFNEVAYIGMNEYGLPGEYYNINQQCTMYQGTSSTACGITDSVSESSCYSGVQCEDATNGCFGTYTPLYPLSGTKCGNSADDYICYKGQCIARTVIVTTTTTSTTTPSTTSSTTSTSTSTSTTSSTTSTTTPSTTTSTSTTSTTSISTPSTTTSTSTSTTPSTTSTSSTSSSTSTTSSTSTSTTSSTPTASTSTSTPTSSTTSSTTSTTAAPTTTAACTRAKCCKRVKVGKRKKKRCCRGRQCCSQFNAGWSSDTKCYKNCCAPDPTTTTAPTTTTTPAVTTTSSTTTAPVCENRRCCVWTWFKRKCCSGASCCSRSWAVQTSCYQTCC